MIKKFKLLFVSIILLVICLISWQLGNYFAAPDEMDRGTSFAIMGFLGTIFFLFTTIILALIIIISKKGNTH
jgi:hypothetical protein